MQGVFADYAVAGPGVEPVRRDDGTYDFSAWERWTRMLEGYRGLRGYLVFFCLGGMGSETLAPLQGMHPDQPDFERRATEFFSAWNDYFTVRHPGKELVFQPIDEPTNAKFVSAALPLFRAIRKGAPDAKIFLDPQLIEPEKVDPEIFDLSDIVCPNILWMSQFQKMIPFYLKRIREGRNRFWIYGCEGPTKLFDPEGYYRSNFWLAARLGAEGVGYWAFGCGGGIGDSWHGYDQTEIEYGPWFVSPTDAMPSKQSEALKEGVEDYELLAMARDVLVQLKAEGQDVAALERRLDDLPRRALAQKPDEYHLKDDMWWSAGGSGGRYEAMRLEALEILLAARALRAQLGLAAPCNPQPVAKPNVRAVRREIVVSIVGEDVRPLPPDGKWDVQAMIDYWYAAMDREIGQKPDLMVLPEVIDYHQGAKSAVQRSWYKTRGDRLFKAMQAYAKRHRIYLVFNSARQYPDGRTANTTWTLDREGDLIAAYDKNYPTPGEMEGSKCVPGSDPVVVDTDFGRLGFVTCFDLNFTHFADRYRELRPDVMCFCSYYDGNYMRRYWASRVQAYVVGATVGSLPKTIIGPSGEEILRETARERRTLTHRINTNFRVIHYDGNWTKLAAARKKYGSRLTETDPGLAGTCTLFSNDPNLPVDDVVREFGMETWREYYARTLELKSKR